MLCGLVGDPLRMRGCCRVCLLFVVVVLLSVVDFGEGRAS